MKSRSTLVALAMAAALLVPLAESQATEPDPQSGRVHTPHANKPKVTNGCLLSVPDPGTTAPVKICYTLFRPARAKNRHKIPMLMHSHGWAGSRTTDPAAFKRFLDAGYGVISFDQRGFGESGGHAYVENPEVEGNDVRALVDKVARLRWVKKDRPGDPRLGAIGGSYGGGQEAVEGIVHVKHAVAVPYDQRETVLVRDVMADPVLVPSTMELDPLLTELRKQGLQIAVVVDEFGSFDGIVTLEDLIEEIVGEVRDEHDPREEPVRMISDGIWGLSGLLRPDEIEDQTGILLPEDEDYETVAGLIGMELGRVPGRGDTVRVTATQEGEEVDPEVELTVLRMDGLRVDRVRLVRLEPDDGDGEEGS